MYARACIKHIYNIYLRFQFRPDKREIVNSLNEQQIYRPLHCALVRLFISHTRKHIRVHTRVPFLPSNACDLGLFY